MKKIINLVTQMEAGGAQGAAIRMSKEMRNRGIHAETWFIYKKTDTYINEEYVTIIHDSPPTNISSALRILFNITKRLKENKPDGIIGYTHYASILGLIAALFAGVKNRVSTIRNPVWTYPAGARLIDKVIGSVGVYTTTITVSSAIEESCKHYPNSYKKRIKTVYNGVPARVSALSTEEARNKFDIHVQNNILLINVGRLHPQKNQQLLIHLMVKLTGYHLAIAGEGELHDELNNLVKQLNVTDRVHLMGEIKPYDIPDFLKCGDVFLFPSVFEAFGFAIFEAAYNGLPIIASNIPSNVEVLTVKNNRKAGIIVEDMSEDAWIKSIKEIEQPDLKSNLIENMKEQLQLFNLNTMVDYYVKYATEKQ